MKITIITYRPRKTLGDVMGAYKTIQALCKDLLTSVKVNFVIRGTTNELQGLRNSDGSSILAAPHEKVDFKVHLFDTQKALKDISFGFKAIMFFLHVLLRVLNFLNNKVSRVLGIGKLLNF